ncbi:MAG: Ig-like domain repeat protein [Terriglobales bacterium]
MFSRVPVRLFSIFVAILVFLSISTTLFAEIHTTAKPQVRVTTRVDNSKRTTLYNHVPGAIRMSKDLGRVDPGTPTGRVIMVLNSDDEQKRELRRVIDEQHDKRTANYHQWVKPEEFGSRFGVHDSDIAQVETWLKSQGFVVEDVSKSKRVIHFSGTTGQLEKAFQTQIHSYQYLGKTEVSNISNITIPTALSPVIAGVTVHSSFRGPHKNPLVNKVHSNGKRKPDYSDGSGNYVGPADFATIYNTNPLLAAGITGAGSSIAIVGNSDIWVSDVEVYRQMFNLPPNDPTVIYAGQNNGIIAGDDQEADSDIELAGGIAPGAKVYYVDGSENLLVDGITSSMEYIVENNLADIISDSYAGGCELNANNAFENQLWEQAAAQGQSVFVASGDAGPADCDAAGDAWGVGGYAVTSDSTPYNVSVGGSEFNEGSGTYWSTSTNPVSFLSALSYIPEAIWNQATVGSGGSTTGAGIYSAGGGISAYYLKPSWQQGPGVPTTDPTVAGNLWVPQYGGVIITGGGSKYTTAPTVTFTGGGCSEEPSATSTLTSGVVTAVTMNYGATGGGFGCTSAPTVTFTAAPSGGTTATGYAVVVPPLAPAPLVSGVPHRYLPDLTLNSSASHDPTMFCTEGDCQIDSDGSIDNYDTEGGTETAAAEMAGIQALINQANGGRQGMPNYYYYSLANAQPTAECNSSNITSSACAFQDITAGSNLICATQACAEGSATAPLPDQMGWTAGTGYDLASGLGSPNAANLATQWNTVAFNSSNTTLSLSQTTGIAQGTPITFSGTVASGSGSGTPTGNVALILSQGIFGETLNLGGAPFATLNNGSYSATLDNLPAGTYTVTARYAGDGSFASSLSAPVTVTVGQGNATVTITPQTLNTSTCDNTAASSFAYGSIMIIQVSVAGASGQGEPTGTVTITENGTTYANLPLDPTGNAFVYAGSIFPSGNGSGLQSCTNQILYEGKGQSATQLPAGSYTIGATYSGDSTFTPATATTVPITVTQLSTTPTLAAGQTEIASGAKVTLTATFSDTSLDSYTLTGAVPPTGTITFKNGTTTLGTATLVPQIIYSVGGPNGDSPEYTYGAAATLTTTAITATASVTAVYAGDTNYAAKTSSTLAITVVTGTGTTTTLTSSANPTPVGAQPTLTATISGSPTSGTVTFYDGTTVLGSTKLTTKTKNGVVTYTALGGTSSSNSSKGTTSQPGLAGGTHSLTAAYSGASTTSLASTSAVYSQVISQASIDMSLSAKTVGKSGQTYMFSANLACDAIGCESDGSTPPNYSFPNYFPPILSNVNFYDGSTLLGSAPALTVSTNDGGFGDFAAQFSTSSLSAGTHTITATYADINYALSTSNAQTVFVGGTPTLTWAAPAAITYGTALSATQLNATDTIPGSYVYLPAAGTVPSVGTQTLKVTFTPSDYTDFGQQTKTVPLTVSQGTTSIAVSVGPSSEAFGQDSAVTITAVLSWTGSGSAPTASAITIGGNGNGSYSATSCGAASGDTITCTATYTPTASDTVGSYTETAVFSGDANYTGSSGSGSFAITPAGSGNIIVSSSQNPSNPGVAVTFTATIPGQYGQVKGRNGKKPMTVTGSVTWSSNTGCSTTTVTAGNPGTATCTTSSLALGADTVTANYSGDSNHNAGSGSVVQTVSQVSTTTAIGSSLDPSGYGQAVSFVAAVTGSSPTGTVAFYVDGGLFDTETLASGTATSISTSALSAGTHSVTATYSGDTGNSGSTGTLAGGQVVSSANAGVTAASSLNPSTYGQSVTFTATINGANGLVRGRKAAGKKPMDVTGSVTWSANTGCGTTTVTSAPGSGTGTATCTTSSLPVGASDTVTANYSGDSNHNAGSGSVSQEVDAVGASVSVGSSLNPADYGAAVSFTATVTGNSPTGTIQFNVDGSPFDTEALVSGSATSVSTSTLAAGTHTVTATYSGDAYNSGSTGTLAGGQVINVATSTTAVTSTPNPSTYASSVTFTATITGENSLVRARKPSKNTIKPMDPSGTVTWSANTGCSASTVTGNPGIATCTTSRASSLPVGTDVVTATYSGDGNHSGSTGSVNQVVTGGIATTIDVTNVSPASEEFGANSPATITAVLSWTGHGVAPTASDVTIGGNGNGTYSATSCAARVHETITCTATYTPTNADVAGIYTETATFSGDTNYTASSSPETNNFTIGSNASTTTVSSGLNPSTFGQSVTFTATITSDTGDVKGRKAGKKNMQPMQPSGTVTWSANTGCAASTLSGAYPGVATCTTSLDAGTYTVVATYSGDSNHGGSSGSVSQTVNKAGQTVSFTTNAPPSAAYNSTFGVAASASSNLTVAFTAAGSCSVADNGNGTATYTMTSGTGACTVKANQAGNSNYSAAPQATESTNATPASQTINVTTPAPPQVVKGSSFTVVASATSGLSVSFASSGACTNAGGTYTMASTASGTCTETMTQAGNSNYAAATAVIEHTTIAAAAAPTVTFTGAPTSAVYGTSFTVSATTNASTTAVITAAPATVCTVSGNTVTMVNGTGTCTVTAKWAADDVYKAATATQKTTAAKANSGLAWATPAPITYGTALSATQLNATANVAGKYVYSPASGKVLTVGTQTLSVKFTPTAASDYTAETTTVQLVVNQAATTTTITASSLNPSTVGKAVKFSFTVAPGKPTGSVTINASTGQSCTGTLASGKGTCSITFTASGTLTMTATYGGDANNEGSTSAGFTQTVN